MTYVAATISVCSDCRMGLEGYDEEELGHPLPENFGAYLSADPKVHYVNGPASHDGLCEFDDDCECGYSPFDDTDCGSCGTTLAGDRFAVTVLRD